MSKFKLLVFVLLSFFVHGSTQSQITSTVSIHENVSLESQVRLYHTQDRKSLREAVKQSILQAKESVLIFAFSLSDPEVIQVLNQKASEGIQVTTVIDKEHLADIQNKGAPEIEILTRFGGEGHLHHKILVVDEQDIWIGSANFTTSAYTTQENLMTHFFSRELGQYLHNEANVFRGNALRQEHGPLLIKLGSQNAYFCHLPHDGLPPKKIEKTINELSKQFLLGKIQQAKNSLKIAMMVWTNNDLTDAVIRAHLKGIKVQIVAADLGGNLPKLKAAGIEVIVNPKFSLMHNKCVLIDNEILINGSANWSQSSFTRSDESFIVLEPLTSAQSEQLALYWNYLIN